MKEKPKISLRFVLSPSLFLYSLVYSFLMAERDAQKSPFRSCSLHSFSFILLSCFICFWRGVSDGRNSFSVLQFLTLFLLLSVPHNLYPSLLMFLSSFSRFHSTLTTYSSHISFTITKSFFPCSNILRFPSLPHNTFQFYSSPIPFTLTKPFLRCPIISRIPSLPHNAL